MIRKLKTIGLALAAVLALSAMGASAVSASPQFTSASHETTVTANQKATHVFEITGLKSACSTATFMSAGHVGTAANSVTVRPTYTGCKSELPPFSVEAKITGFGHYAGETKACGYLVHANGTADLVCESGAEVTIEAGTCITHIPAQTGLGTFGFDTGVFNGTHDLTLTINVTKIQVSHTDGFACPFNGSGSGQFATYTGESTVTGETTAGAPVGITQDA
jgi:hypothetical protein